MRNVFPGNAWAGFIVPEIVFFPFEAAVFSLFTYGNVILTDNTNARVEQKPSKNFVASYENQVNQPLIDLNNVEVKKRKKEILISDIS